jgi:hypothetical protein
VGLGTAEAENDKETIKEEEYEARMEKEMRK